MDDPLIDDVANRVLAWPCRYLLARRIAGWAGAAMLALAAGATIAAAGSHNEPEVIKHRPSTPVSVTGKHGESRPAAPQTASSKVASGQVQPALPVMPLASSAPHAAAAADPTASSAMNALPAILPVLSDEVRLAAIQEGKRLRSMAPLSATAPALPAQPVRAAAPTAVVARARPPAEGAAAYALVTDITSTRIASELRQQLMGSSATVGELPGTPRAELMQVSAGWRAVVWPFATEKEAAKARRLLAERGIRTELLKF